MAEAGGRARVVHARGFSAKQRLHLAALLIFLALPLFGQSDIDFDPTITQAEFETFSRLVAQGIYATPVDPARARGLLGFDIGVAATAIPVDTSAAYWQRAVETDFTISDHLVVPRVVVTKGLSVATISASYSQVPDSDIKVWGAALDVPILSGGVTTPTLAVRGAYATLQGADSYDLNTYGAELFLSKGFGPVTPYGAIGIARSDAEGRIDTIVLTDEATTRRITVGVKLSLFIPKIIVEATQGEERSYAAKVSFGL
ncbi:MAG TPA: hypothetical protein VNI54_06740 [Thermoanaerobaculia bacterium]|nr:hypothetical protein [Thermoanaerobaculia bacterium]